MAAPTPPATLPHLTWPLPLLACRPGPPHIAAGRPGSRPRLTLASRATAGGLPLPGTAPGPPHRPHRTGPGPMLAGGGGSRCSEWWWGGWRPGQPPPTPEGPRAAGAGELALVVSYCVTSFGDMSPKLELIAFPLVPTLPLPLAPLLGLIPLQAVVPGRLSPLQRSVGTRFPSGHPRD